MKKLIKNITSHPLISGSAVIILGSMLGNVFNYLFTLSMVKLLSVSEYGTLASLISLFNIFVVFAASVITVFSKFSASFVGVGDERKIGSLLKKGTRYVGEIGIVLCLPLIIFSPLVSGFLHINSVILIILVALALFLTFLSSVPNGILQGVLNFRAFSAIYILGSLSKFIFGLALVFIGLNIFGAVFAIFLSTVMTYLFSFFSIKKYLGKKEMEHIHLPNIRNELTTYGIPVLLSGVGLTLMYAMDVILVKHFFSPDTAGQYGALSLMGRIIFFIVAPITQVFFPLITQKRERKEGLAETLFLTVLLIGTPSVILSAVYFAFPGLILHIFAPAKEYAMLAPFLGFFSIFILFYTFSFFLNSFFLSTGRTKVWIFTMIAACVEILFIVLFHSSLWDIVYGLTGISFLLFISLLIYYFIKR